MPLTLGIYSLILITVILRFVSHTTVTYYKHVLILSYKLLLNFSIFCFFFVAYDCGVFVIATAEHLCKELCEGYSIPLIEIVTQKTVTEARRKIKDLIYQTAKDYSGS